jgi:transcription termination factor NusB
LAKNFGGENSRKFINGVLGTVYREIVGEEEEKVKSENNEEE